MKLMIYFILFILGLCIGSFLNVLIYREAIDESKSEKGKKKNWITGRSYCDHCKKQITWFDNVPLFSYILLQGKCRYCHKKIPFQYPLVELLTGLEFIWVYFLLQKNFSFFSRFEGFYSLLTLLTWLMIAASFLAIIVADIRFQIIPDSAIILGIIASLIKIIIDYRYTGLIFPSQFFAGIVGALFFVLLIMITKGKGMGWGDVKLVLLMGLILGFPKIVVAIFISFLTGAILGVILIILQIKKLKSKIAFGPFLIIGTLSALLWGDEILKIGGFL